MINELLSVQPNFSQLAKAVSLERYLAPAFGWNPVAFRQREVLRELIISEMCGLPAVPLSALEQIRRQLDSTWSVQTAEHVAIPRTRDKATQSVNKEGVAMPSHNPMVFQGVVLWAAMSGFSGYNHSLAMATGRVPPNNALSGAYLEVSREAEMIRVIPDRWRESPQMLIPALTSDEVKSLKNKVDKLIVDLPENQRIFWKDSLAVFDSSQGSFCDQIVALHGHLLSGVMPVRQVTVESERVASRFLARMLREKDSVIGRIFSNTRLMERFSDSFSGIGTGWKQGEAMFFRVESSGCKIRLSEYVGGHEASLLADLLETGQIYPKGVLKFFAFMADGGLLSIGGMIQSVYNSQIRDRAVSFLLSIGDLESASELRSMPTELSVVSPCWGWKEGRLIDFLDCIDLPLSQADFASILSTSGRQSLRFALPVLYPFYTGKVFTENAS